MLAAMSEADRGGSLPAQLERHGLLSCVLASVGEETARRLQAPPPLRQQFMRLAHAQLLLLQVCPRVMLGMPPSNMLNSTNIRHVDVLQIINAWQHGHGITG